MDPSIDQLLVMATDNEKEQNTRKGDRALSDKTTGGGAAACSDVQLHINDSQDTAAAAVPDLLSWKDTDAEKKPSRNWNPPMLGPLPPDFLRLPTTTAPRTQKVRLI